MTNQITTLHPAQASYDPRTLALIRRTVAKDCNDDEFDLFVHTCKHLRLDPLRRQIYAFVFSKDDAKKRRMSIVTAIDGLRAIADRTGAYRPDEDEPRYEIDPALVAQDNPIGLVKATVTVHKFAHGAWHPVTASAYWDEFAPVTEGWSDTVRQDTGQTWPDGNPKYRFVPAPGAVTVKRLDTSGQWGKMPRLMLAKVAESQALRRAWPDDFADVYTAEEVDRSRVLDAQAELLPSEAAQMGAAEDRLERISQGVEILVDWMDGTPLDGVPLGRFADRVMAFLFEHADEPAAVQLWQQKNVRGLREFWAHAPGDALEVKREIEGIVARIAEDSGEAAPNAEDSVAP
jgi:phage recombination protein Bet